MAEKPLVYLILGATGSGRREIVADWLEEGGAAVILPEGEAADPADSRLGAAERWRWNGGAIEGRLPAGAETIFFLADGRRNPVDQIEAFGPWLETQGAELARIVTVVDCRLAEQHPPLLVWYDVCVHFSDVVLLNRREGVANKWVSDFQARIKGQFYPCLIEVVKEGRVRNPALILEPRALRMSHAFDDEVEWEAAEEEDEEAEESDEKEVELQPAVDPYFVRLTGGRREKEIPHIEKYL